MFSKLEFDWINDKDENLNHIEKLRLWFCVLGNIVAFIEAECEDMPPSLHRSRQIRRNIYWRTDFLFSAHKIFLIDDWLKETRNKIEVQYDRGDFDPPENEPSEATHAEPSQCGQSRPHGRRVLSSRTTRLFALRSKLIKQAEELLETEKSDFEENGGWRELFYGQSYSEMLNNNINNRRADFKNIHLIVSYFLRLSNHSEQSEESSGGSIHVSITKAQNLAQAKWTPPNPSTSTVKALWGKYRSICHLIYGIFEVNPQFDDDMGIESIIVALKLAKTAQDKFLYTTIRNMGGKSAFSCDEMVIVEIPVLWECDNINLPLLTDEELKRFHD